MLSFRLSKDFVAEYEKKSEPFPNALAAVTFYRTYARKIDDQKLERWVDTCERVVNGMYSIQKDYCLEHKRPWSDTKAEASAEEAFDRLFNLKWSPPGRGLSHMGAESLHERGYYEAVNNCAFISTASIKEHCGALFSWAMEMLMFGVGVGFDVRGANIVQIKEPHTSGFIDTDNYIIPDTREGWAESIEILVNSYIINGSPKAIFDYSQIRQRGAPINGFGGVASGPEPLIWMHEKVTELLESNIGRPLSARLITDIMNMIGRVVVAGNVRRSSEIALGFPDDEAFINLKNYDLNPERAEWGWSSNNSLFATLGMDYKPFAKRILDNGEPGFFWPQNANKYGRMNGTVDARDKGTGLNPCFASGTLIHTRSGHLPVESLIGKIVDVWDGEQWVTINNFRITGENQKLIRIELQDGSDVIVTPYHTMILEDGEQTDAGSLVIGDKLMLSNAPLSFGSIEAKSAYVKGFLIGDGTISNHKPTLWLYDKKQVCVDRLASSILETSPRKGRSDMESGVSFHHGQYSNGRDVLVVRGLSARDEFANWCKEYKSGLPNEAFLWNKNSIIEFITGLFDADGTSYSSDNGFGYQLTSINKQLISDVQMLLKMIGVRSKVSLAKSQGVVDFGDGYGEYKSKPLWRLSIAQTGSIALSEMATFERLDNLSVSNENVYTVKPRMGTIVSIEDYGVAEKVYCCTVPTNHQIAISVGVITGQCAEQILEGYSPAGLGGELCTLVEIYLPRHTDIYDLMRSIKFAYLYGKTVTLLSEKMRHAGTREIMMRNRRIGLSVTGVAQFVTDAGIGALVKWLGDGYDYAKHYDRFYSGWLGVNESVRITSVKPSGTVSLLAGVTPGVHYPHSEYYIRRVRLSEDSHLVSRLISAGVPVEKDLYSPNTLVASFPIHSGDGIRRAKDLSIWEQLELAAIMQQYWSDNSVSVTVSIDPNKTTAEELTMALEMYQYRLKSVSLLPEVDGGAYEQMPYEEISKNVYNAMTEGINLSMLDNLHVTNLDDSRMVDAYCDGIACEIPMARSEVVQI